MRAGDCNVVQEFCNVKRLTFLPDLYLNVLSFSYCPSTNSILLSFSIFIRHFFRVSSTFPLPLSFPSPYLPSSSSATPFDFDRTSSTNSLLLELIERRSSERKCEPGKDTKILSVSTKYSLTRYATAAGHERDITLRNKENNTSRDCSH